MFKINIMSIIKYISAIAYFYLAYHALYLVDRSKASPPTDGHRGNRLSHHVRQHNPKRFCRVCF